MAQLVDWLALAGACTSAGAPVASGTAWFYEVGGGTTLATVYSDVDGTVIASNPATLDAGGRAQIYVTSPVRIVVQDSTGADVSDHDQADVHRAEAVQLDNAGWSDSYLDGVLTKLYTSTGGTDGMYQESGGATARTIKSKFAELTISVKDFGAKGDGLTVDTTAVQAAINRVGFLGGGEVYFPPGTYLIDQTLSNAIAGVSIRGAGQKTIIKLTSSTLGLFSYTAGSVYFRDLYITNSSATTGAAIALSGVSNAYFLGVYVESSRFRKGISMVSTCQGISIDSCQIGCADSDAAARALAITDSLNIAVANSYLYGGTTGQVIEFLGASSNFTATGSFFSSSAIKFNTGLTGSGFRFVANGTDQTSLFIFGALTMPKGFFQRGNGIDGYKVTIAGAGTVTPDLTKGDTIYVNNTTTGAVVIAVPSPPPSAVDFGVYMNVVLYNHAGAGTTWDVTAYHVSSNPSTTDTHRTSYRFWWDPDVSVWRDVARTDTT